MRQRLLSKAHIAHVGQIDFQSHRRTDRRTEGGIEGTRHFNEECSASKIENPERDRKWVKNGFYMRFCVISFQANEAQLDS